MLAGGKRAGERALGVVAAFRRFAGSEIVGSVENGIAREKIDAAVKLRSTRLSDDLKPGAAWAGELGGVRVLVDADFLNGGGRDAGPVRFDAIHDQGDAVGANAVFAQEAREQRDIVLIEDGDTVERVAGDGVGVLVLGGFGGDLRMAVAVLYVDYFGERSDGESYPQRRERFGADGDRGGCLAKAGSSGVQHVFAGREICEGEGTRCIRRGPGRFSACDVHENNFGTEDLGR